MIKKYSYSHFFFLICIFSITCIGNAQVVEMSLYELEKRGYTVKEYTQTEFDALQEAEKQKKAELERERKEAMIKSVPKEETFTAVDAVIEEQPKENITNDKSLKVENIQQNVVPLINELPITPIQKKLSELIKDAIENYNAIKSEELKKEILERVKGSPKLDVEAIKTMPMTKANLQELLSIVYDLKL